MEKLLVASSCQAFQFVSFISYQRKKKILRHSIIKIYNDYIELNRYA